MRILLIEDEAALARPLKEHLEADLNMVEWFPTLDEADAAIRTTEYDVVLLDLQLPDGAGLTFLSTVRDRALRTPIIILTARDKVSDRIDGLNAGADDYLVKPFAFGELSARLTALSRLRDRPHLPGRGYGPDDLIRLERLAYGAALGALCFFVLGVFSPHSAQLYSNTLVLSFAALPMAVWLTRVIRLSVAGRESYDPLRFVVHDPIGLALLALAGLLVVLAV